MPTFLSHAANLDHAHGWKTVEKASRASHAFEHVVASKLAERCQLLPARVATEAELLTVHTRPPHTQTAHPTGEIRAL